jgi:putative copper resistance protein D
MATSLLILARAFHFGSGMMLVGVVAFRWLILLPAWRDEPDETWREFAPLFRRLQGLFLGAGVVLILSGLALFWAVAAEMSDTSLAESLSLDTLGTVFFQTQFGSVFQWRLGLAILLALSVALLTRNRWLGRRQSSGLEIAAGGIAVALVVSIAGTGHAAATGGPEMPWRIMADATHLVAASIWPAGLLPFALCLSCARRAEDFSSLRPFIAAANRFSAVSFGTVGVLAATGLVNAAFMVGSFPALISTDYGRLLCLKLFLFFVILCLAAWNRYRLVPLLSIPNGAQEKEMTLPIISSLRRFVMTEFALALAIILVVSLLGITPPPR